MTYTPHPQSLQHIELPDDLQQLVEQMALNVHETWAAARLAEGWKYGPHRDDARKLHPCLVPYDALPDSEREYDRATAVTTLKFILSRGYHIEKTL